MSIVSSARAARICILAHGRTGADGALLDNVAAGLEALEHATPSTFILAELFRGACAAVDILGPSAPLADMALELRCALEVAQITELTRGRPPALRVGEVFALINDPMRPILNGLPVGEQIMLAPAVHRARQCLVLHYAFARLSVRVTHGA